MLASTLFQLEAVHEFLLNPAVSQRAEQDKSTKAVGISNAVEVIIDSPPGEAFQALESRGEPNARAVVVTFNCCAEHWEDLWELQPAAMVVCPANRSEITHAAERVLNGQRYRLTPAKTSLLTLCERRVLRYLAKGQSNKEIANALDVQEKSVRNALTNVFDKLHLKSRTEAVLYYWGVQPTPAVSTHELPGQGDRVSVPVPTLLPPGEGND